MSTSSSRRTVTLDADSLAAASNVLLNISREYALSRRQRNTYLMLTISVDVMIVSYLLMLFSSFFILSQGYEPSGDGPLGFSGPFFMMVVLSAVFVLASIVGIVALLLNIPLIRRTLQERKRLRKLGVTTLSKSLWKASRRHRWLRRLRGGVLIVLGVLFVLFAVFYGIIFPIWQNYSDGDDLALQSIGSAQFILISVIYLVIGALLLGVRQLRNLREQMDLTTNAEELEKVLETFQKKAGKAERISVPADLIDQAAKIESMQIDKARTRAILSSADTRQTGCAVVFDKEATAQRRALSADQRLQLEELLVQLSAGDVEGHAQEGTDLRSAESVNRVSMQTGGVEIEYMTDPDSRKVRVRQVRAIGQEANELQPGGDHD